MTVRNWYEGQPSVAVDLDGTLCTDRFPGFGDPQPEMVAQVRAWHAAGWWVVITTSRPHPYYGEVAAWLTAQEIPYHQLICAAKPNTDAIFDDKAGLPPAPIREAWAAWQRAAMPDWTGTRWDPLPALLGGKLTGAWAAEQATVPENPAAPGWDPALRRSFRVAIPLSGGLDSTTCWAMAEEAGLEPVPFYVDLGQPYRDAELAAVAAILGHPLAAGLMTRTDWPRVEWQHIRLGRNAAILLSIARSMTAHWGWWGEIWFGNLAGESPVIGGDKSSRFLGTLQGLIYALGYDVRIVTPLIGMDKPDLVRWWRDRGRLDELARTRSCFAATTGHCGRCQACFRRYVAYRAAGVDPGDQFGPDPDWTPFVRKYFAAMTEALGLRDWSRYSPGRCHSTLHVIIRLAAEDPRYAAVLAEVADDRGWDPEAIP